MEAYKFETTVLENGVLQIPEISKYKNQEIEVFIVLKSTESATSNKNGNISFEQWNKQFNDNRDLGEILPDLGISLGDYRKKIYDAEMSEDMTINEFKKSLNSW